MKNTANPVLLNPSRCVRRFARRLAYIAMCAACVLSINSARAVQGGKPTLDQRVATLEALVSSLLTANESLQTANAGLQSQLAAVQATLAPVKLVGTDLVFEGCNVHIRSGSGSTAGINGLGNLIIGYNEPSVSVDPEKRSGSHNLVIGRQNDYFSYGGFVAGLANTVRGPSSSVCGGFGNTANGEAAVVGGGSANAAQATLSVVSGGTQNQSFGFQSVISGGHQNQTGDQANIASGLYSAVSGGEQNVASGRGSVVGGGTGRSVNGADLWVAGALLQPQ